MAKEKVHVWFSRRNFLSLAGWGAFTGFFGTMLLGNLRYMFPRVLFEPNTKFKAGYPEDYTPNSVSTKFIKSQRVWIVRTTNSIFALSGVCTHLGCTPRYLESENKFKCPCHGSGFRGLKEGDNFYTGINFEGPAPRPLERYEVSLAEDGQLVVDKAKSFRQERDEWSKHDAILKLS